MSLECKANEDSPREKLITTLLDQLGLDSLEELSEIPRGKNDADGIMDKEKFKKYGRNARGRLAIQVRRGLIKTSRDHHIKILKDTITPYLPDSTRDIILHYTRKRVIKAKYMLMMYHLEEHHPRLYNFISSLGAKTPYEIRFGS